MSEVPEYRAASFRCPVCEVVTAATWKANGALNVGAGEIDGVQTAICQAADCQSMSVWVGKFAQGKGRLVPETAIMTFPAVVQHGPPPSPDLPADLVADFEEARRTVGVSPRGAAALARLVVQNLCAHLGGKGENINDDIGDLVRSGKVSGEIQKALDVVRIVGNNSVHPGTLDLRDDAETAVTTLRLINMIVTRAITEPREVGELFESMPKNAREGVEQRDK